MRNFIRQIYTVAAIALLCNDACVSAGKPERTIRLRRRRNLKSSKSSKSSKSPKSPKGSKSGGVTGRAISYSTSVDETYPEPSRKGSYDDDRSPDDDYEDTQDNVRVIVPVRKPDAPSGDFAFGTTVDDGTTTDEENQSSVVDVIRDDEPMEVNSTATQPVESGTIDIAPGDEAMEVNSTTIEQIESNNVGDVSQENESEEGDSGELSPEFFGVFEVVTVKDDEPKEGDSVNEILENQNNEEGSGFFNFVTIEDGESEELDSMIGEIADSTTIEDDKDNEETEATVSPSDFVTEERYPKFEGNTRTVQIMHPGVENECMTFDYLLEDGAIFMAECSDEKTRKDDHWEILQLAGQRYHFQLRHKSTKLCIPMNPEKPDYPFNCVQYFGMNEAIADSFKGLVNCYSDNAAIFEVESSSNLLSMANAGCGDPSYIDPIPIFMTYNKEELTGGRPVVVWGGHVLMGLAQQATEFNFNWDWKFVDVEQMS